MIEKLREQLEIVLKGEANLLESAHKNGLNIDEVEYRIREALSRGIIFGSGDQIQDLVLAGYWQGRRDQFMASMAHMFGKDVLESTYNQVCLKLGIQAKRLN